MFGPSRMIVPGPRGDGTMQETTERGAPAAVNGRKALARKAFSLVEVMIVLAIIMLIMGIVAFALIARQGEARTNRAQIDIDRLKGGLLDFQRRYGRFPTEDEGLAVLWSKSTADPEIEDRWSPTFDAAMPNDPWGSPWEYNPEGLRREGYYDLSSNGEDKEPETDDDIHAWEEDEEGLGSGGGLTPPG